MSNSLLEAMSTGLPCLATAIGGNTDLLGPGPSGLLLPGDDPAAWSDALIEVLTHPDRAWRSAIRPGDGSKPSFRSTPSSAGIKHFMANCWRETDRPDGGRRWHNLRDHHDPTYRSIG